MGERAQNSGRRALRRRLVAALAVVIIAQVPAQSVRTALSADPLQGKSGSNAPAMPCAAKAPSDPPIWEQSLPIASVPPDASASDPSCVSEIGRSGNEVAWRAPDGTLSARTYSQAMNYQAPDGSWQAIDTRLGSDGKGGTVNRAGPFSASFAANAAAPQLVKVIGAQGSVSFSLDGTLNTTDNVTPPSAQATSAVSGDGSDTITYANTLSGVDIQYQMLMHAVKEAIVLNQPLAATTRPDFHFTLTTTGLTASTTADGTVQFADAKGAVVFAMAPGQAYDADGAATTVSYRLTPSSDSNVSELDVAIDPNWLADPARVYPVTIDPSLTQPEADGADAYVANGASAANNYHTWGQLNLGLSKFVDKAGTTGGVTYRSLQNFDLSGVSGDYIVSAHWHGYADAVSGTTPAALTLYPITSTWSPSTVTWNTQPAFGTSAGTTGGYSSVGWQSADITSTVRNFASGSVTNNGFLIGGPSNALVQLDAAVGSPATTFSYVDVNYDAYPQATTFTANGLLDSWTPNTHTPTLSTELDDSDTSSGLYAHYQIYNSTKTTMLASGDGSHVNNGEQSNWTSTTSLADGTYWYNEWISDGIAPNRAVFYWFPLTIDTTAPSAAPGVSASTWTANTWNTSAPSSGTVTLSNGGVSDVTGYYHGLDQADSPSTYVAAGSSTVTLTPDSGWHDLVVRSQDHAGNMSVPTHFLFGQGSGGFSTPAQQATTGKNFVVTLNSTTGYDGFTLQYRRSESDGWTHVPAGDVTFQSLGTGISSWPVHCTGWTSCTGTTGHSYPTLVWNASSTLGTEGAVQLQAIFWTGATIQPTIVTSVLNVTYDPNQFGGIYANSALGPGSVNLLTGNYLTGARDATQGDLSVSRYFNSRDPNFAHSFFGPGWASTIAPGDLPVVLLTDNTTNVVVHGADGTITTFRQQTDGSYKLDDGTNTLTLVKCTTGGATCSNNLAGRFELNLLNFETVGFQRPGSGLDYMVVDLKTPSNPGVDATSWTVLGGVAAPTQEVAAPPNGVTCSSSPLTTRGCRTLTFAYGLSTTASGTAETSWGDYLYQLKTVSYTGWDPDLSTPAMSTVAVASYLYDSTGHLRAAWDPRVSTLLKTRYSYNTNGQIATLTPPGLQPFTFNYAPIGSEPSTVGRLASVQRPTITGTSTVTGTATSTVVYQIPLSVSGGGPYDMLPANTATWAQTDNPTDATAIYPPDEIPSGTPPSSYTRATVTYMDINGQAVNVAQPGGEITTSEQDSNGSQVRALSAGNRQRALASSTDPVQQAADARLLDTQSVYDGTGLLTDTLGPAHVIDLPDATTRPARVHTHNTYDQGAPGGGTYNLVTTATESAQPTDGSAEQDTRTTTNAYAIGTDVSGWTLGSPLQTTVDPGTGTHLNLTTTTLQDATTGQLTERRLPGNPSGGDAHATVFVHYTAGTNSQDGACGNRPEWTGLACKQAPAAQPGTSGLPTLKVSYVTKYNLYGQPEETQDKDTTGATLRTTTVGYDTAGRQISQATSGVSGTGAAVNPSTTAYDTNTGLTTTTQTTTGGTQTITRAYDTLGRMLTYTDADSNTTTYTYDVLDRLSTMNDGKATTTYTYDDVGTEERGLLTTVSDSSIGTFTATYNADGQLANQVAPGGLTATYTYDEAGELNDLAYSKGTGTWPDSPARYNIHGERTATTSSLWWYNYSYDAAGRLTNASEQNVFGCVNRAYTFDADANRTALATIAGYCPATGTPTTTSYSYDSADRITGSGYSYDSLGRTTAMPAANSSSGYATTLGYYSNDLVNTITSNSTILTYNLDPNRRAHTWSSSADSQTHTNHYTGDTDSPAWTSENTLGSSWTRNLSAFGGMTATITQAGTIALEFTNVHGDIIGTAATTDTTLTYAALSETDEYGRSSVGGIGSRYDYLGAAQRQRDPNSGLQLMGQRAYNPATGRFLQTDPVVGGSANSYDYVSGDPVNASDLSGRSSCGNFVNSSWGSKTFLNYAEFPGWGPPCGFQAKEGYYPTGEITRSGFRYMAPRGHTDYCSHVPTSSSFFDFHWACATHDYLYDLMRFENNSGPFGWYRWLADKNLSFDMHKDCTGYSFFPSILCNAVADTYYLGVTLNSVIQNYAAPNAPNGGILAMP
jgi:RHS repeat-associated protein